MIFDNKTQGDLMKKLLVLSMLLASVSSFAGTGFVETASPDIKDEKGVCTSYGLEKMLVFGSENGVEAVSLSELESVRLVDNDRRLLNPSHYSWYEMELRINGEVKTIRTLVQYDRLNKTCI